MEFPTLMCADIPRWIIAMDVTRGRHNATAYVNIYRRGNREISRGYGFYLVEVASIHKPESNACYSDQIGPLFNWLVYI